MAKTRPPQPIHKPHGWVDTSRERDRGRHPQEGPLEGLTDEYLDEIWDPSELGYEQSNKDWTIYDPLTIDKSDEQLKLSEGIFAEVRHVPEEQYTLEIPPPPPPPPPPRFPVGEVDTPAPPPTLFEQGPSEALQAKDEINVKHESGDTETGFGLNIGAAVTIKTGGKTRYLGKTGAVLHPCQVLEGGKTDYNIKRRKHVKTGNSKDRLKQIRRAYAFINC